VPLEELGKTYLFNGYAGHTVKQNNVQRGLHYRGAVLITGLEVTYNWESRDANAYTTNFISNWCEDGGHLYRNNVYVKLTPLVDDLIHVMRQGHDQKDK